MILAQISAPTPNWGQPPSTVTRWLVFITLVSIVSTSRGLMVRRFITCKSVHLLLTNCLRVLFMRIKIRRLKFFTYIFYFMLIVASLFMGKNLTTCTYTCNSNLSAFACRICKSVLTQDTYLTLLILEPMTHNINLHVRIHSAYFVTIPSTNTQGIKE